MRDDLYFLPLLAEALREHDPRRALADTIRQIRAMGGQARYRRGSRQFGCFLAMVAALREEQAYRHVVAAPSELERSAGIQFILQRDGIPIDTWAVGDAPGVRVIGGVVPGTYRLHLDTGRLLWVRRLGAEQLLWTRAFPGMPLQAAADTGPADRQGGLVESVLEGAVTLRVYPGLEAGLLSVEWRAP